MLISIVIPTLGRARTLSACLDSCFAQDFPRDRFEVIVVLNGGGDPAAIRKLLAPTPVRILLERARGVNSARNRGIEAATGELVFFLDDDCVLPDRRFLERLLAAFERHPGLDVLGGEYESAPGTSRLARGYNQMTSLWLESGILSNGSGSILPCRNLLGGNVCIRNDVFREGLRFDPSIESGGDETEFLRRLEARGKALGFSRNLAVKHRNQESLSKILRRGFRHGAASFRFSLSIEKKPHRRVPFHPREWGSLYPFLALHWPAFQLGRMITARSCRDRGWISTTPPTRRRAPGPEDRRSSCSRPRTKPDGVAPLS